MPTGQREDFVFLQHIEQAWGIILLEVIGKNLNWRTQKRPPKNFHDYPLEEILGGGVNKSANRATR